MYWIGTSGYSYPEWKGSFYPEDLSTGKMLGYYSDRFSTVEINNTFYRMPSEKVLSGWAEGTPEGFAFTLKAPRRITHDARLRDCENNVTTFCERSQKLGPKLGVLLFQTPPWLRKNLEVFDTFAEWLPAGTRAAFEFRHESWFSDDVYERLRARNLAFCVSDNEKLSTPMVSTADYGYFRLRDEGYGRADIKKWAGTIADEASDWDDVFVYFKHEKAGKGTEFAKMLREDLGAG
ncbi:MAG: DUF72 domain-containing protein [Chloroflexi bacterium]|nr:DUF72 domain-containing protein [Chloroflexota bacterium]